MATHVISGSSRPPSRYA